MSTPTAMDASSAHGSATHASPTQLDRSSPHPRRTAGVAAIAAVTAVGTYVLVDSGLLTGYLGLLPLLGVLVLMPSHRLLVRRLSLNLALFLGLTPVLWWVSWPVDVNHAAVLVATGSAIVVASSLRGVSIGPVVTWPELALVLGAPAAAGLALWRWLSSSTPQGALEQMVPGFDNWAHFGMFWSMRRHGAVLEAVASTPDGSGWAYGRYPMGFHSVVASLSELIAPGLDEGARALPAFLQAQAILVMLGLVLVTSSILALKGIRRRPMVALPAVAVATSALVWEPGQRIFADGFTSLWLAAVAVGATLLISIARSQPTLVDVGAVSGLILLVCHCWLPLAVLAGPAGLLVLIPFFGRGVAPRRRAAAVLVLALGAAGSLKAVVPVFTTVPVGLVVDQDGGYNAPALVPVLVLVLAGCIALLSLGSARRADAPPLLMLWQRVLLLATPIVGLVILATLFAAQVSRNGVTSYYFVKLLLGYELVLVVLVPAVVATLVVSMFPRGSWGVWGTATSLAISLSAAVAFGVVTPSQAALFDVDDPGTASLAPPYSRASLAAGVLTANASSSERASFDAVYMALGTGNAGLLLYPDAWFHALNASTSANVMIRAEAMRSDVSTPQEAADIVTEMLAAEPNLEFLVPEESAEDLRDELPARLAEHIVTIPRPGG